MFTKIKVAIVKDADEQHGLYGLSIIRVFPSFDSDIEIKKNIRTLQILRSNVSGLVMLFFSDVEMGSYRNCFSIEITILNN